MAQSALLKFWNSAAGPKTIHFWAPTMKWGLVIAGLSDLQKPANQLSLSQNLSLGVSGIIWTRYGFVVLPKNYMIAGVNFFVFLIGTTQVGRILNYRRTIQTNAKDEAQVIPLT
ncbi:mitochondrial pyruvate carrier [Gilbertella persicaria]|uniref:mitochondrial pyruvate carrier n=1 Tax=Gilbertella persicaria TaxID=101096 RepID=UPI00222096FB|nr:mitochondrial pyruvate carrier [Gilbertella persicaria]KAI8090257.1 mitochondrial pyruvate carrier [Gilbertella persicaria]